MSRSRSAAKGMGRNFSRRGGNAKRPKISKKYRKIALFASSRGANGKKTKKILKIAEK